MDNEKKDDDLKILLTRHGKTIFNTVQRVQGWSDTPLTNDGIAVAKELGSGLKDYHLDAIYSSTSGRAIETSSIVANASGHYNLDQKRIKSIREFYFGKYEGEKGQVMLDDIANKIGNIDKQEVLSGSLSVQEIIESIASLDETNEAESWEVYSNRLLEGLNEIIEDAITNKYQNVLVVSHGYSISALLYLINKDTKFTELTNASVSKIRYSNGNLNIESVDDMSFVINGRKSINSSI